jgi:Holliday junction resolvase RusA-like endonuclease
MKTQGSPMVKIIIPNNPIPLKRHRHTKHGHTYNPQATLMEQVGRQAKYQFNRPPITNPISVKFTFFTPIPNSYSKKKKLALDGKLNHKRPDLSNYIKFYEDALNGIIWQDDALIVEIYAQKIYSLSGKTEILIKEYCEKISAWHILNLILIPMLLF